MPEKPQGATPPETAGTAAGETATPPMPMRTAEVRVLRRRPRPARATELEEEEREEEEEEAREGEEEEEREEEEEEEEAREGEEEEEREEEDEAARARRRRAKARAEEDDAVVEISMSSETPVERYDWWEGERYREVLGHGPGEVDLDYARDGIPFLVGHDIREQVGIIEDVRLDNDRRLRGTVRFSRSARARDIRQDMLDGIRKKISVGYEPGETFTQTEEDGVRTRRYTNWRLLEASSVPIPADYEVGVGRSARPGAAAVAPHSGQTAHKAKEIRVTTTAAAPAGAERTPQQEIAELARQHGMTERLPEWIGGNATLEQVRNDVLKHYQTKSEAAVRAGGAGGVIQLTERETEQYSIVRALRNAANGVRSGFEFEISEQIAKELKRAPQSSMALFVPTNLQRAGLTPRGTRAPMAVSASAAGQELKFTEYGGFIPALRNRAKVLQLGARLLSGLQGDLGFVTQPSVNTFAWGAETTNPSATNFGTGLRTMAPKVGAAVSSFTRQLLAQSVEDVESLVWDDITQVVALAIDAAAISGPGTASQPTGILNTTGIGAVTIGTAGGALAFGHLVGLETEITTDNADAEGMALLTTPGVAGQLKQTQQFSGTNGVPIWTGTVHDGLVNGYRASITKQVPQNLTKGSNTGVLHAAVFGAWPHLYIGEWGAMEMIVDPYSLAPTQIKVSTMVMVDVFLRYVESFAACKEVVVS